MVEPRTEVFHVVNAWTHVDELSLTDDVRILRLAAQRLSLTEFSQRLPDPVLWIRRRGEVYSGFATQLQSPQTDERERVLPIRKRSDANRLHLMVTLGRAQAHDLVVSAGDVSKFHAYVLIRGDRYTLCDAGSTCGTRVNGVELEVRDPVQLTCGDHLQMGSVDMLYLTPGGLHRALRAEETPERNARGAACGLELAEVHRRRIGALRGKSSATLSPRCERERGSRSA